MNVSARLRGVVIARAGNRCEYCGLSQEGQEAEFHVDHVIPVSAKGPTTLNNLALACVSCSLRKGARQHAVDPETGQKVNLFNPREDGWTFHFRWVDEHIAGITETGRATITALGMNRPLVLAIRREERFRGRHP